MSPPEVWGPPVWTLFHTLSAQLVNDDLIRQLFNYIQRVCKILPCPECSQDATIFLQKVNLNDIKTSDDLSKTLYIFHNHVNRKKHKPLFNYSELTKYKTYNLIKVFHNFARVYNTRGNMRLIADEFQRSMIMAEFKRWIGANIISFKPVPLSGAN
jgi:hypothetical protein